METAGKKQNTTDGGHASKGEQQGSGKEKTTDNRKSWWEQLTGVLPDNGESATNWNKLLSNPLIVLIGLLLLGCWIFTKSKEGYPNAEQDNGQLKREVKQLRKKYKKLKKRIHAQTNDNRTGHRFTILD